ncbi:mitochondrial import inner membrane translocase subunit tim50 [Plakobranchus ocellatus]|uniref:Mitochondrial import inner membrane translocase subunit TIM50 n=1 Tax=Plakobranchus ocellatus TaxID=259542 RepID=A0AAV3YV12_9GAST|nr:mitochondrial import inner membrane translocase subunit tim50 [Plakobranchus ocellatus]
MATFTVVMRSFTKGHTNNLQRYIVQSQVDSRSILDVLSSGVLPHISLKAAHSHHQNRRTCFSSSAPASQCSLSQSHSNLRRFGRRPTLYKVPYPQTVDLLLTYELSLRLSRKLSTSTTDPTVKSTDSSDKKESAEKSATEPEKESEEKSDKEPKKESWWRGKNSWRLGLIFLGGTFITWGVGLVNIWGAPQLDPDGNEIKDEFTEMPSVIAYLRRTWKEMNVFKKKIQDPSREQLLPDPLKYPYIQPPYTLVIELTGVLIHPDWTYSTGWRFKKRPGIDYFLQQVGPPLFEVVIYSQEAGMTADPLVNHLDPQGYIMYRLYRDATRYMDGKHVKDLSCLNREMSRIIMLDCSKDAVSLQPRNSLVLQKWVGEDEDRKLIDLAHFLKTIAASGVDDIRPVLDYYNQFDDPLNAFKDNQRKLQEEEEARQKRGKDEAVQKKGWLSGFGIKR